VFHHALEHILTGWNRNGQFMDGGQGGDDVYPVQGMQVVKMNNMVMLVLGTVKQVSS
jgi:hypothetical protein